MGTPFANHEYSPEDSILTVTFQHCACGAPGVPSDHAVISKSHTELINGRAAAISYTYGAFERPPQAVGHFQDNPNKIVALKLGREWVIDDLIYRLTELSEYYGALWLDQLCFGKDSGQPDTTAPAISAHGDQPGALRLIPAIYRTLDVVTLLPGAPCACLVEAANVFEDACYVHHTGKKLLFRGRKVNPANFSLDSLVPSCLNIIGTSSYFERLWTHQEFSLASRIRVVWCQREFSACVSLLDVKRGSMGGLSAFARALYDRSFETCRQRLQPGRFDREIPAIKLVSTIRSTNASLRSLLWAKIGNYESAGVNSDRWVAKFLLGEPVSFDWANASRHWELGQFEDEFCGLLERLKTSPRTATFEKDYVLSIWPDCSSNITPYVYCGDDVSLLLEDQLIQLEQSLSVVVSRLPKGLFKDSCGSFLWRPSEYLRNDHIRNTTDVYGPMCLNPRWLETGHFGFRRKAPVLPSRLASAIDYRSLASEPTKKALKICTAIFEKVARSRINAAFGSYDEQSINYQLKARSIIQNSFWVSKWTHPEIGLHAFWEMATNKDPKKARGWRGLPEIDHYEAMYRITARMFNVNVQAARSKGLQLMIVPDELACIGFTRLQDLNAVDRSRTLSIRVAFEDDLLPPVDPMDAGFQIRNFLVYELLEVTEEALVGQAPPGYPHYRVAGVWLECSINDEERIGNEFDDPPLPANAYVI